MSEAIKTANKKYADAIDAAIDKAREVVVDSMAPSREQSLVLTKLDEAQMWAHKGLSN